MHGRSQTHMLPLEDAMGSSRVAAVYKHFLNRIGCIDHARGGA